MAKRKVLRAGNRATSPLFDGVRTVECLFGRDGVPYETLKEAARKNPKGGLITINFLETGGCTSLEYITKI